jgi:hypothetical protein
LVGGEGFAVDVSLIAGERGLPRQAAFRTVDGYLDAAFGAATEIVPKFISPADPAARWTGAHGG